MGNGDKYDPSRHEKVRTFLGIIDNDNLFKPGPPKQKYRIKQKIEEYSSQLLSNGISVLTKFKDLHRAAITCETFLKLTLQFDDSVKYVSSKRSAESDSYQAFYVILEVDGVNFELQVVNSIKVSIESHLYYEIIRDNSLKNLELFLRRHC